jgi:hypothetical protein
MPSKTFAPLTPEQLYNYDRAKGLHIDETTPEEQLVMGEIEVATLNSLVFGYPYNLVTEVLRLGDIITKEHGGRQPLPLDLHERIKENNHGDSN